MDRSAWVVIEEDWAQPRQSARVEGDKVSTFRGEPFIINGAASLDDGGEWLPIVNMDSRPFDYAKDYRLKPFLVRDGERVCRVFPVINQFDHDARRAS